MNINFKAQPEPQLNPYEKTTYFVSRHSPHPKTVCHIKGLNDAPVCVVKDRGFNEGHFILPSSAFNQLYRRTGTAGNTSLPSTTLPSLGQNLPKLKTEQLNEISRRLTNTPLLKKKDDPVRRYLTEHPQSRTIQDHHLSSGQAMRYRPEITENINYAPTYLENEIKVLEKLRDILQTDSLAEIQNWLARASIREKEFVSNFIRSDVTSRDLLNYQQKVQTENEAKNLNLQTLLKSRKGIQKTPPDESNQIRPVSQASTASKRSRVGKDRNRSLSREKIKIPTSDNLPLENSHTRNGTHESLAQAPASSQTSTHLLYRKSRSKRHYLH
ncbi:uncharacterized protein C4orf17 homolog [Sceloporus undulatus]|uniref:uncharacterized protein C4orf17 homolog n=1 Tax=Sceloporus undulatus TaxID=8520 RepID=UPI001C4AA06B|nr:uncharacterized protein C4orf17 homolog [Sceloporus undulatus]XP_042326693.1 uncharacterized protein C4orf17 homolog [Sceloporus undulatus]XP_042326694.1 uncharacterized protein C4orf17 homolog [Sceloporus undulatus]